MACKDDLGRERGHFPGREVNMVQRLRGDRRKNDHCRLQEPIQSAIPVCPGRAPQRKR